MKNRRQNRKEIISIIYKYYLLEREFNLNQLFEEEDDLDNSQFNELKEIFININKYELIIKPFLKDGWTWDRISPLIKGILIYATYEFAITPPKIVVNEAIEITKEYFDVEGNEDYKMVNAILSNVFKLIKSKITKKETE
ncbi:transcription antitermination protein NusB [Mycoplasma sp. Mirounga ES2805-ORL]|uniref:transcription antitermination protein NusB n=1 Tax=Mycoplasma sp. Mirounga ES2805-ORL TaxID=754514 RepID=UPI00197B37BD|nr:transcription antitermination protein NusB [Mycoplasma sp. Mirounga ES2805-ORL]QSF13587.1 transcription antitermination protein NusB [Mycoplasma sp. Mirounga ES2805-ORL]